MRVGSRGCRCRVHLRPGGGLKDDAFRADDENFWTIESLICDTSAFASALGRLAKVSDYNNLALIQQTWPVTWAKHVIHGKKMATDHATCLAEQRAMDAAEAEEASRRG